MVNVFCIAEFWWTQTLRIAYQWVSSSKEKGIKHFWAIMKQCCCQVAAHYVGAALPRQLKLWLGGPRWTKVDQDGPSQTDLLVPTHKPCFFRRTVRLCSQSWALYDDCGLDWPANANALPGSRELAHNLHAGHTVTISWRGGRRIPDNVNTAFTNVANRSNFLLIASSTKSIIFSY